MTCCADCVFAQWDEVRPDRTYLKDGIMHWEYAPRMSTGRCMHPEKQELAHGPERAIIAGGYGCLAFKRQEGPRESMLRGPNGEKVDFSA